LLPDEPPLLLDEPPLLLDEPPLLLDEPPLLLDEPPLLLDEPPDDEPPPLLELLPPALPPLREDEPPDDELPLLLETAPRDDEPPEDEPPLLLEAVPRDEPPPLLAVLPRVDDPPDDAPPLLLPLLRVDELPDEDPPPLFAELPRAVPPLFADDVVPREPRLAALAAAAPSAAPAAAPAAVVSGLLRRLVLRCSLSPRPALKPTVVRSGILISVPVRGLRPVRAERVRRVNFPKPGMDSDPAACTASEMAPDAVSKIASTTRAAAALVSSALSATMSTKSDLFMCPLSRSAVFAARPVRASRPLTQHRYRTIKKLQGIGSHWTLAYPRPNPERKPSTILRALSAASPKVSLAVSR
jgi:hypothetical protein